MNFRFTDEQRLIRDEVRSLLERSWTGRELRGSWRSPENAVELRRKLAEIGARGLTVPEKFGGSGGTELDLVLVLEEYGRAGVPDSLAVEAGVAVPLLAAVGEKAAATWLPKVAAGQGVAVAGLGRDGYVVDADLADVVVIAHDSGQLMALERADTELIALGSVDGARRPFRVLAKSSESAVIVPGIHALTSQRLRFVEAAMLLGLCQRMLGMAVDHALTRQQFGQPIGAFQAIKHRLADAKAAVELARPVVYAAAWALASAQPDQAAAVAMAKLFAARAAAAVGRHALQVHGGIGFAAEHDLHLYLKHAKALELASGGLDSQLELLAAHLEL